jgi:hypothetical protein
VFNSAWPSIAKQILFEPAYYDPATALGQRETNGTPPVVNRYTVNNYRLCSPVRTVCRLRVFHMMPYDRVHAEYELGFDVLDAGFGVMIFNSSQSTVILSHDDVLLLHASAPISTLSRKSG